MGGRSVLSEQVGGHYDLCEQMGRFVRCGSLFSLIKQVEGLSLLSEANVILCSLWEDSLLSHNNVVTLFFLRASEIPLIDNAMVIVQIRFF